MGIIDDLKKIHSGKKEEFPISKESALEQFYKFLEYYGLQRMVEHYDTATADTRENVEIEINEVIMAIRRGKIIIDPPGDKGLEIKQILSNEEGTVLTYREMNSSAVLHAQKYKTDIEKVWGVMGYLSSQGIDLIKKLKTVDRRITELIGNFLLTA